MHLWRINNHEASNYSDLKLAIRKNNSWTSSPHLLALCWLMTGDLWAKRLTWQHHHRRICLDENQVARQSRLNVVYTTSGGGFDGCLHLLYNRSHMFRQEKTLLFAISQPISNHNLKRYSKCLYLSKASSLLCSYYTMHRFFNSQIIFSSFLQTKLSMTVPCCEAEKALLQQREKTSSVGSFFATTVLIWKFSNYSALHRSQSPQPQESLIAPFFYHLRFRWKWFPCQDGSSVFQPYKLCIHFIVFLSRLVINHPWRFQPVQCAYTGCGIVLFSVTVPGSCQ